MAILNTKDLPKSSNQVLKPGTYTFTVNEFEEKKDRNDNAFIYLKMQLVDPEKKFYIFDRFYLSHPNQTATNVGKARLRQFFDAVGYEGVFDSEKDCGNFIDSDFMAEVKIGKDMNGDEQTQIKKFIEKVGAKKILDMQNEERFQKATNPPAPLGTPIRASEIKNDLNDIPF